MSAILGIIGSLAFSFGIPWAVEKVQDLKARMKGMTNDQIVAYVQSILSKISSQNSKAYNAITSKLSRLPDASMLGSVARRRVAESMNSLQDQANQIEKKMQDVENVKTRAQNFAYQSSGYKTSRTGRQDWADIEKSINKISKGE